MIIEKFFSKAICRYSSVAACVLIVSGCSSLNGLSTPEQKNEIRDTENIALKNKEEIRSAADASPHGGVLVFVNSSEGTTSLIAQGSSPHDAWMRHVRSGNFTKFSEIPMPSSISRTAVYVPSGDRSGSPKVIHTNALDEEVRAQIDLAATMSRIGGDMQRLRDMTVLLAISDKKQNDSIAKLSENIDRMSESFSQLNGKFDALQGMQATTRAEIISDLNSLAVEIRGIKSIVESMR